MLKLYESNWVDVLDHIVNKMGEDEPYRKEMVELANYLRYGLPKELLPYLPMRVEKEPEALTVYVDGGCHGNGTSDARAYGSYKIGNGMILRLDFDHIPGNTNNLAEYKTLIRALWDLTAMRIKNARIKMDSQLVVNQVNGTWRVKEERLKSLCWEAKRLLQETGATLEWVGREEIVKVLGH